MIDVDQLPHGKPLGEYWTKQLPSRAPEELAAILASDTSVVVTGIPRDGNARVVVDKAILQTQWLNFDESSVGSVFRSPYSKRSEPLPVYFYGVLVHSAKPVTKPRGKGGAPEKYKWVEAFAEVDEWVEKEKPVSRAGYVNRVRTITQDVTARMTGRKSGRPAQKTTLDRIRRDRPDHLDQIEKNRQSVGGK